MSQYDLLRTFFRFVFRIAAKIEISGLENFPAEGPYILALNHLTILDPPAIFVALPFGKITVFAADKWEKVIGIGWLLETVGAIFVNRGEVDRRALQAALKVLKEGGILGMAPEGTRSGTGGLIRAKPGIAYLATKANVPILPVGLSGQTNFKQELLRFKRLHLRVKIGPLIHLPSVAGPNKTAQLQEYADQVMITIAKLIDPELRGVYAAAVEGGEIAG